VARRKLSASFMKQSLNYNQMNLDMWTVSAGQSNLKLSIIESETDSDIYRVEEEYPVY